MSAEDGLFTLDRRDGRIRDVSEAFAWLLGKTVSEVSGRELAEVVFLADRQDTLDCIDALGGGEPTPFESRFVQSNGQAVYVEWVARPCDDPSLWRAFATDTADLEKLLAERRDLKTRLDLAVGQATAAMWDLEIEAGRFNWETQAAGILGVGSDQLPTTAEALIDAVHPDDRDALGGALTRLLEEGTTDVGIRVQANGSARYLSLRGRVLDQRRASTGGRAVGLLLDVTTEKALEEQLLRMSVTDGLTGVRNRRGFDQALKGEWRRCVRADESMSILMVDIDNFKRFNDTFGHIVGDQALVGVTRALSGALNREGDILARYGGEEFAVVLPGADDESARLVADRLLDSVRDVKLRQAADWSFSVSIGTATWLAGQERIKATELLIQADQALYAAKRAGRDRVAAHAAAVSV